MSRLDSMFLENKEMYILTQTKQFIYLTIYNSNSGMIENHTFDKQGNKVLV